MANDISNKFPTFLQVKTELDGKQAILVSGTNIKTINSQSLLGSGNIIIEGGGGTSDADNVMYDETKVVHTAGSVGKKLNDLSGDVDSLDEEQSELEERLILLEASITFLTAKEVDVLWDSVEPEPEPYYAEIGKYNIGEWDDLSTL